MVIYFKVNQQRLNNFAKPRAATFPILHLIPERTRKTRPGTKFQGQFDTQWFQGHYAVLETFCKITHLFLISNKYSWIFLNKVKKCSFFEYFWLISRTNPIISKSISIGGLHNNMGFHSLIYKNEQAPQIQNTD